MNPDAPPAITEEMKLHDTWFEEAKAQTLDTLPVFIERLMNGYQHDYGTVCHAITACAVATAWACNNMAGGGITGFQGGAVMWGFIQNWGSLKDQPLALRTYRDMLYPQYADEFDKTISAETWGWLQKQALERLEQARDLVSPDVLDHWRSIADGQVPFGYRVQP